MEPPVALADALWGRLRGWLAGDLLLRWLELDELAPSEVSAGPPLGVRSVAWRALALGSPPLTANCCLAYAPFGHH